jgi:hypothetical protein
MSESTYAFWFLFVITLVGSLVMLALDDAEGAGTPHWEPDANIDEVPLSGYAGGWAARGPDNIVRRVYQTDDYGINVSYTDNNGSTWSDLVVIDSAWKGHTGVFLGGIVVLANNTTIVHFTATGADDNYNAYVACRWNWSGTWDIVRIYGHATTDLAYPKMAVNETTVVLLYVTSSNTIRYKTFDPTDSSFDPVVGSVPNVWVASWTYAYDYDVTVNQTGSIIICSKSWSGSVYRYYVRDLDLEQSPIYAAMSSGVIIPYGVSITCTSDDLFVVVSSQYYSATGFAGIKYWKELTLWGGFQTVSIDYRNDRYIDLYSVGTCIDDNDRVTIYWANETGAGEVAEISKTTADHLADEATWEAAIVPYVYDYGDNDDVWYSSTWYDGAFPKVGGYSVNIPDAGWMGHHTFRDEPSAPNEYRFALYWNATFHWYDWSPPSGPGPGPEPEPEPTPDPGIDWSINVDDFLGPLWLFFIILCVFIAVVSKVHDITEGGR